MRFSIRQIDYVDKPNRISTVENSPYTSEKYIKIDCAGHRRDGGDVIPD